MTAYILPALMLIAAWLCLRAWKQGMELSGFIGFWTLLISAVVIALRVTSAA